MIKRSSVIGAAVLAAAVALPAVGGGAHDRPAPGRERRRHGRLGHDRRTRPTSSSRPAARASASSSGSKLLVFDFSVNFLQIVDGDGLSGTLIQGLFGTEIDIPVGTHASSTTGRAPTSSTPGSWGASRSAPARP